jgi:predicted HicB family RNase H-like nuclease
MNGDEALSRTARLRFRCKPELKAFAIRAAEAEGISVEAWMERTILNYLEQREADRGWEK